MTKLKPIPQFTSDEEEHQFWANHDVTEYMSIVSSGPNHFPNLKPSTETISLRLPKGLLDKIKLEASSRDVPYQSYMKIKLSEAFGYPHPSPDKPSK